MSEAIKNNEKIMTAETVLELYTGLASAGVKTWLDGGWGVDALLSKQSRPHGDVDLIVQEKDVASLNEYFNSRGYSEVQRDDSRAWNYVLADQAGNEVDVHVIVIDEAGNGIYGPAENGDYYPASALQATGTINGETVNCLSPEYQLESHTGYEIRDKDVEDVSALCEKFSLKAPEPYAGKI